MKKQTAKHTASEILDELMDKGLAAFATVQKVQSLSTADDSEEIFNHWTPATKVVEMESEKAMAAFSNASTERHKSVLVLDDFGAVAQLSATVYSNGRVLIERRDDGYISLRVVNESGNQIGNVLANAGDYIEGFVSSNLTDPSGLEPFLQLLFPEDDLDV
jgi:hypothetical protein